MKELLELETPHNLGLERRSWRIERAGWLALALLLGAALAGLLGPGPLSTRELRSADGTLAIRYPRFARVRTASQIQIRLLAVGTGETRLWLDSAWAARLRWLGIAPLPVRTELARGGWVLVFTTSDGTARELDVSLDVEPRAAGWLEGSISLEAGARIPLRQLVYP